MNNPIPVWKSTVKIYELLIH